MSAENKSVSAIPSELLGTPAYYQWRHNDFTTRNSNVAAPDYYLKYGFKYAQKFQNETSNRLSVQGQKWVGEVMANLQMLMENRLSQQDGAEFERNAQAFKDFAFSSHVEAYWNENGTAPLYTLTFTDLFRILFTPDFRDVIRAKSLSQIVTIMGKLVRFRFSQFVIRKK